MGNIIVKKLTLIAKGDLDVMKDEESQLVGPKPLAIKLGKKPEFLRDTLRYTLDATVDKSDCLQFKNEFVVLVRNNEEKRKLPKFLKNAICMTIKESKGLEFEDVLIYNYFDSYKNSQAYFILKSLSIISRNMKKSQFSKYYASFRAGKFDQNRIYISHRKLANTYEVHEMIIDTSLFSKSDLTYEAINYELKSLYVAITRAKNRLIIYDEIANYKKDKHPRSSIEKLWKETQVVSIIDKLPKGFVSNNVVTFEMDEQLTEEELTLRDFREFNKDKTAEEFRRKWLVKAVNFFRQGKLDYSRKCFKSINHKAGEELISAFQMVNEIQIKK